MTAAVALAASACGGGTDATVTGRVADSAGQPLPGAVIVVGGGSVRGATVAHSDGTYSLSNQPTGDTPVHVFAPGFVYDAGHTVKSLNSGANTYNPKLKPQRGGAGPRFGADPTVTVSGSTIHLRAQIVAGPGSPVGSELLAVDVADGRAVLLTMSGGTATGSIATSQVHPHAQWLFIATDDACQESTTFPTAQTPS
jgi:hypothetical protein